MIVPTISACNLFTQQKQSATLVVHCLDELLVEDVFIPKKPHRHTFYQIIYIKNGKGIHKVDFNDYEIADNSLFFLAPGQVHNLTLTPDSTGILVNFDVALFRTFLANPEGIDDYPFFEKSGRETFYQLGEENASILDVLSRIRQNKNKTALVRIYLLELFYLVNQNLEAKENTNDYTAAQKLLLVFDQLVEKNYDQHHYPKTYASNLAVTPSYLNAVCQKVRGKTAGEMIRDRIRLEAKRLLINSKLSIAEISYLLGFDDNSYFTKFFKQQEGVTPGQFRKSL